MWSIPCVKRIFTNIWFTYCKTLPFFSWYLKTFNSITLIEIFDSCNFIWHFVKGDIHLVNRDRLLEVLEFYKVTSSSLFAIDVFPTSSALFASHNLFYLFYIICIWHKFLPVLQYFYVQSVPKKVPDRNQDGLRGVWWWKQRKEDGQRFSIHQLWFEIIWKGSPQVILISISMPDIWQFWGTTTLIFRAVKGAPKSA